MSTRAQICIKRDTEEFNETGGIFIYKHSDGYPSGVMPILSDLVKRFHEHRGNDAPYLLCQIVRTFAIADDKEGYSPTNNYFVGWGLDTVLHGDTEYLYEIDSKTGKIFINGKEHNA